jgi:hypothetical protein
VSCTDKETLKSLYEEEREMYCYYYWYDDKVVVDCVKDYCDGFGGIDGG